MEIKNTKVYGLEESIKRSSYPHTVNEIEFIDVPFTNELNRAIKLGNSKQGSGHDTFLKGIIVQFDLKYPQYFTPQLQRYHWVDIRSSQSKMHSLIKIKDIENSCNKYVLPEQLSLIKFFISRYNNANTEYPNFYNTGKSIIEINSKQELFQYIISNLPMGFEMWMGITTNYLQLKTIYNQRKAHKLEEWRYFCDWIKELPMSNLIINEK